MRKVALWLLGAVMLPLAVGCSQNSQIIRGQSPDVVYSHGQGGGGMPQMSGVGGEQYCPPQQGGYCPPDGSYCPPGGGRFGGHPQQTNYWAPCDLAYPPENAMPGIVQYPYYTLKGPDCFFRK